MKRKPFMIIILTILLIQPIIAGSSIPNAMGNILTTNIVSQGFRVDPSELVEHVPILINGTEDFVSQGWEGAGTSGDPYIISKLNITYDVGQLCIEIINTTAYFVIVDCFVKQDSQLETIKLTNTTHGTIEYCTVYGHDVADDYVQAISLERANNTIVHHVESYGRNVMGLYSIYSYNLEIYDCLFDSQTYRAMRIDSSASLSIDNCEFYNYDTMWWCVRIGDVNQTSFTNCEFYSDDGIAGLSVESSWDLSIVDCYIWAPGAPTGLDIELSPEPTILNLTVELAEKLVVLDDCPGFDLTDAVLSEAVDEGLVIMNSPNSTVHNIEITDTPDYGIHLSDSSNTTFSAIDVEDVNSYGIYCTSSDLVAFDNISVMKSNGDGFYASNCHNGSINNAHIANIADSGIYIDTGANWTITNNIVENTDDYAIYQYEGDNTICINNIVDVAVDGIAVDSSDDAIITGNTVTEADDIAISGSSIDRGVISENQIIDCADGIDLSSSTNVTVYGNSMTLYGWYGIDIYSCDTSVIEGNTITNSPYYGITLGGYSQGIDFIDNVLNDCGFYITPSSGWNNPLSYTYFNHTFTGNTINGMDLYYARDLENTILDADDYAQFILLNASDVTIHDGTFGSVTCPIEILHSEEIEIENVIIPANVRGIVLGTGENITISDTSVVGISHMGDYSGGIISNNIDNLEIQNCEVTRAEGIQIVNSEVFFLNGSSLTYCDNAIRGYNSDNMTITSTSFMHIEQYVLYAFPAGQYTIFNHNEVINATRGVYLEDPDCRIEHNYFYNFEYSAISVYDIDCVIHDNEIYHAGAYGIYLGIGADYTNITENYIESCDIGLYLSYADNVRIMNNTILYSDTYAINIFRSTGSLIYYNIFALSGSENARDRDSGTYFKTWNASSSIGVGNWWDDASPPATYFINGGAGSVDSYPQLYLPEIPIIDHPLDLYYPEGSEGNELSWHPFDDNLDSWELYIDDTLWDSDAWDFVDVSVNVDGLAYGSYEARIVVYDIYGNNVTDTVMIYVYDDTNPVISNLANTWAFVGGSGQVLTFEVYDLHPANYVSTLDEEEYVAGTWTTGTIVVSIDGLTEGEHALTMTIYDVDGNSAQETVLIRAINDDTDPTIDSPADIEYYVGETGNSIVWEPQDEYPASFSVEYNGTTLVEGSWGGARVVVNVDGLTVGTHQFTLSVEDGSGNGASDTVTVTVLAIEGVEPPPEPLDIGIILAVVGVAAGATVVIVVIMLYKKKATAA